MEIANTIIDQLGGYGKLAAMINAKYFTYDKNGTVNFRFSGCKKMNHIKISLNLKDLYDVEFYKIGRFDWKVVANFNDVYAEDLKRLFKSETGLDISL